MMGQHEHYLLEHHGKQADQVAGGGDIEEIPVRIEMLYLAIRLMEDDGMVIKDDNGVMRSGQVITGGGR